jgi:hypothetical protein
MTLTACDDTIMVLVARAPAVGDWRLSALGSAGRRRKQMQVAIVFCRRVGARGHVNDCQHTDDQHNGRHGSYDTPGLFSVGHDHLTRARLYAMMMCRYQGYAAPRQRSR